MVYISNNQVQLMLLDLLTLELGPSSSLNARIV
jgi:hypothetical protein